MEPVTAKTISTVVSYLANKLKDNKSAQDFFSDFTVATADWIRPFFLKNDNDYKKIIVDLLKNPDSPIKKQQVETAIASHLEDQPNDEIHLKTMYEEIQAKEGSDLTVTKLEAKEGMSLKVKQENSRASIGDLKTEGKININIKQK